MKNLSDFKKRLNENELIRVTTHTKIKTDNGNYKWIDDVHEPRKVIRVKSNSFTIENENGSYKNVFYEFPKSCNLRFPDENTAVILQKQFNEFVPSLSITFLRS